MARLCFILVTSNSPDSFIYLHVEKDFSLPVDVTVVKEKSRLLNGDTIQEVQLEAANRSRVKLGEQSPPWSVKGVGRRRYDIHHPGPRRIISMDDP